MTDSIEERGSRQMQRVNSLDELLNMHDPQPADLIDLRIRSSDIGHSNAPIFSLYSAGEIFDVRELVHGITDSVVRVALDNSIWVNRDFYFYRISKDEYENFVVVKISHSDAVRIPIDCFICRALPWLCADLPEMIYGMERKPKVPAMA